LLRRDRTAGYRVLRRDAAKYHIDPKPHWDPGIFRGRRRCHRHRSDGIFGCVSGFLATSRAVACGHLRAEVRISVFIAVMDAISMWTNGCMALFTLWKEAGRPVEIHVYDHANGPALGMR